MLLMILIPPIRDLSLNLLLLGEFGEIHGWELGAFLWLWVLSVTWRCHVSESCQFYDFPELLR